MRLIIIITLLTIQQTFGQGQKFEIKEANMIFQVPNKEWSLATKKEGDLVSYIFKRNPVTDSNGRKIIPAMMIYVEDAADYDQDVTMYTINKRLQFQVDVDKMMIHENENYPISYKNSIVTMCRYSDGGLDHILYMIHIITKENKGIQIYMDMTKDLVGEYEQEFWEAMKSIKEI
ncbi:hypothetical protein [Pseudochryseolinea flava]|uniref:PsbP C-terminal domain-containing protein n=1 Tax=Pseudochryseolinea flava TaxID=2059302 RepID=A0A364XXZ1_9BACT|nr:hypothetical protein [Pseudochryseolinea flava]RAV98433.1 hypothetical protein DQQ10_24215 [Pseudochryseolinea flava]